MLWEKAQSRAVCDPSNMHDKPNNSARDVALCVKLPQVPYGRPHDKTNKMTCAPSDDSDQPGHLPSLIRVFAIHMKKHWALATYWAHSKNSDQTGRMPRLIWVFAGQILVLSCGRPYSVCVWRVVKALGRLHRCKILVSTCVICILLTWVDLTATKKLVSFVTSETVTI